MKLTACTVSGNSAALAGGGIGNMQPPNLGKYHLGYSLAMYDCTVSANTVEAYGGGIYNAKAFSLDMIDCTVSGNSAIFPEINGKVVGTGRGGGIRNLGTLTMANCTVYENSANNGRDDGYGGGISGEVGSTATLYDCTIWGNTASVTGDKNRGGDLASQGRWTLDNCIVADSQNLGGDIFGGLIANFCFIDDPTSAGGAVDGLFGDIVQSENPNLSDLGFQGRADRDDGPAARQPGHRHGRSVPDTQGNHDRPARRPRTRGGEVDIGATESGPITITVNSLADDANLPVIDGSVTTLRDAIDYANSDVYTGDTIIFAAGLTGTIALAQGALPAITTFHLTIDGPGANLLTIDAQGTSRIFSISAKAGANISGLTLANGSASSGGAIVNQGTLTLGDCTVSANTATVYGGAIDNDGTMTLGFCTITGNTAASGGGIYNDGTAALTLNQCSITDNTAAGKGGGIDNQGTLTLTGSTISGDTATGNSARGGGLYNEGTLTLVDSTIANNLVTGFASSGGAIYDQGRIVGGVATYATLTLADCTVAGNTANAVGGVGGIVNSVAAGATLDNTIVAMNTGGDLTGDASGSDNLIDNLGSSQIVNGHDGNIIGLDPKLGPLSNNGGPTQTMALLGGSPAINSGSNALVPEGVTIDQRGALRIKDGTVDIGAFEGEPSVITVTTLADSAGSGTTLRQAIDYVNNIDPQGGVTITFAAGLQGTLDLTQGSLPLITGDLAIVGPGANLLTIDAQGNSRILSIASGADVTISGLTLADGSAAQGGGILNSGGTLTMSDCTVSGNTAGGGSPGIGGGIFNGYAGGYFSGIISGTLTLVGCTLSGNSAIGSGGALWNDSFCNLTMIDCTVSGNGATDIAALALIGSTNTIDACTVSGNTESASRYAAGITVGVDGATINDTIVVGNTDPFGASDLGGGPASGSNNLIGALTNHGSVTGSNNQVGVTNPMLGPLAYNGGTTQTMALLTGSPAIGAGAVALLPPGIITDQRGSPRIKGGAVDIGAFESGPTTLVVTSLADVNSGAIDLFAPDGITLREAIAFAAADPGDDTIVFSPLLKGAIDLSLAASRPSPSP